MRSRTGRAIPLLCVVAFLFAGPLSSPAAAGAQDVANDVSDEVSSPFCPGVTLHDCPSAAAGKLRSRIAGWARDGWTKERILQELEAEYGPDIRAVPGRSGGGVLAWVLPGAVAIGGAIAVCELARSWSRLDRAAGAAGADPGRRLSGEDRRRVEAELAAFKGKPWSPS